MTTPTQQTNQNIIEIDFLFLDLETCTRCKGTDANLEAALSTARAVLEAAGAAVSVRKTLVDTEQRALELGFTSSPTIRVNGRDIALELRETLCESCADACGSDGEINCRVWTWQGQEFTEAPAPMILDAILSAVYGGGKEAAPDAGRGAPPHDAPENLKRFFASKAAQPASACCSAAEQETCCEASEKPACCAGKASGAAASDCGCR